MFVLFDVFMMRPSISENDENVTLFVEEQSGQKRLPTNYESIAEKKVLVLCPKSKIGVMNGRILNRVFRSMLHFIVCVVIICVLTASKHRSGAVSNNNYGSRLVFTVCFVLTLVDLFRL